MSTLVWIFVTLALLVAFVVLLVTLKPSAGEPINRSLQALEGVLRAMTPWGTRSAESADQKSGTDEATVDS